MARKNRAGSSICTVKPAALSDRGNSLRNDKAQRPNLTAQYQSTNRLQSMLASS